MELGISISCRASRDLYRSMTSLLTFDSNEVIFIRNFTVKNSSKVHLCFSIHFIHSSYESRFVRALLLYIIFCTHASKLHLGGGGVLIVLLSQMDSILYVRQFLLLKLVGCLSLIDTLWPLNPSNTTYTG